MQYASETFWTCLKDALKTSSQEQFTLWYVLKTSGRCFCKTWRRYLEDLLNMSWRRFCKTPCRRLGKRSSWRFVDDFLKMWFFFFFLIWIKIVKSNFQLVEIRPLPALLDYPSALLSNKDALLLKWNFSKSNFDLILLLLNKQFLHFFISYVWNILTHISHI